MLVAVHQPHYLPWLGYFDKFARADLFVFLDDVQFARGGWQNRNFVKTTNGVVRLTVPVVRRALSELILEKHIDTSKHWKRKHFDTITQAYSSAAYATSYLPLLKTFYSELTSSLCSTNIDCCTFLSRAMGINTPFVRSSELGHIDGAKSSLLLGICHAVGARGFLSGDGSSYLDRSLFAAAGIDLVWQCFKHPTYRQRHMQHGFIPRLSALDLLLNEGPRAAHILGWDRGSRA